MMSGHRKTIGRNFNSQATVESSTSGLQVQYFTLKTGRKVKFTLVTVPAAEVAEKTFVRQETNGRDQSALTKDSLKDITRTIRFQQFFACIGVMDGEKIEILDGSRRRASAIEVHTALNVMVTSDKLTAEEARQLAKDIQTAKEHNIREIGLRLLSLKESGLNQKEIAEQEGLSQAKVTRAIQAATVPQELISLFPVQYELSFSDYKNLSELNDRLKEKSIEYFQLIESISAQLDVLAADDRLQEDEKKAAILKLIAKGAASLIAEPPKEKTTVSSLWEFADKDKFARKRVKGRSFTYEFNRLPKNLQNDIDSAIQDVLKRHSGE
ncbi:ParB family protein [Enterobacter ludwigii]|uniref:ParB family protein n=1 Tax=Enterobacter ludwigii TaxID=299767 RepID=UPI003D25A0EB